MAAKKRISANHPEQSRLRIFNVLKAACDDKASKIVVSPVTGDHKTLMVEARPRRKHVVKVQLTWTDVGEAHYMGHFVSNKDDVSQAILSLYNQYDAAQFVVAMNLLGVISARVPHKSRRH